MAEYIEKETARAELIINDELYAADIVKAIPAADVVEVVKCKNCKNRYLWLFCGYFGDEDYCPKGAKTDGGVNDGKDDK